jgi:hypothetical protein
MWHSECGFPLTYEAHHGSRPEACNIWRHGVHRPSLHLNHLTADAEAPPVRASARPVQSPQQPWPIPYGLYGAVDFRWPSSTRGFFQDGCRIHYISFIEKKKGKQSKNETHVLAVIRIITKTSFGGNETVCKLNDYVFQAMPPWYGKTLSNIR